MFNAKRKSRLQVTVKETFGMNELQNNTVIVLPTYITLNKRVEMDYTFKLSRHVSSLVPRGYCVSQGNNTQMQICEKQFESPDLREII